MTNYWFWRAINLKDSNVKNIIRLYTQATALLLGFGVFADAEAATFKCIVGGRTVYSNVAADCNAAEKKETLAAVYTEKYPLDLGARKVMGAAAHAYLAGMSLTIPRYETNRRDDLYGEPTPMIVPDLSHAEYNGNGGYTGGREYDDYGAVRPRSYR